MWVFWGKQGVKEIEQLALIFCQDIWGFSFIVLLTILILNWINEIMVFFCRKLSSLFSSCDFDFIVFQFFWNWNCVISNGRRTVLLHSPIHIPRIVVVSQKTCQNPSNATSDKNKFRARSKTSIKRRWLHKPTKSIYHSFLFSWKYLFANLLYLFRFIIQKDYKVRQSSSLYYYWQNDVTFIACFM